VTGVYLLLAAAVAGAEPSIKDLGWMIGDWSFHDVSTEAAGFSYEERGIRSCRWALRDQYIRCESQGGSAARPRTYVSYINYNASAKRFEIMSIWSNHPPKLVQYGQLSPDSREFRIRQARPERDDDGNVKESWAIMKFDGRETWTWDSGSRPEGAANDGPVRFRDVAVRRSAN
jgi:hypothetical protein